MPGSLDKNRNHKTLILLQVVVTFFTSTSFLLSFPLPFPPDRPQVQVKHEYTAHELDQLDLYRGEVIKVYRRTVDGWCEGERVGDGQWGWFPLSFTEEM